MRRQPQKVRKRGKVVSLDDYRAEKSSQQPTIHIRLMPDGQVEYQTEHVERQHAFQVLAGCYAVAGQAMMILEESLRCCKEKIS